MLTELGQELYRCETDRCVLELAAPSGDHVRGFLSGFAPPLAGHHDRWEISRRLVRYQVDWPLWHEVHARTHEQLKTGGTVFDPWEHSEASSVSRVPPIDFPAAYRGLINVCPFGYETYFVIAWHSRELLRVPQPLRRTHEDYEDFVFFSGSPAAVSASEAPLGLLVKAATRSEFRFAFASLGLKAPRSNDQVREVLQSSKQDPRLEAAFRRAPRWKQSIHLKAPTGFTWGEFQDFRYLLKGMASDIAAFYNGFRVFTPTEERYAQIRKT